jgi:hypothetical protein
MIITMRDNHLKPIISLNHVTLPLWVLTPPATLKKRVNQMLLPSPLRDLPYGDPPILEISERMGKLQDG